MLAHDAMMSKIEKHTANEAHALQRREIALLSALALKPLNARSRKRCKTRSSAKDINVNSNAHEKENAANQC